jgi:uncharacterized protein YndB with AHSA1/START domain
MTTSTAATDNRIRALLPTEHVLDSSHPAPAAAVAACLTFAWRSVLKVRHIPEQLLDVVAIPVVFTLMFTYLFGGALAGSTGEYLQSLLRGTLVMTVLLLTMYTGVGLSTDRATGSLDRFRSMPIWRPAPIVGALVGDLGRYLIAAAQVLGLGAAMGFRPDGGVGGVGAALVLILAFGSAVSWLWTDSEHLKRWYGPDGATILVAELDVRVGGTRRVCMEAPTPSGQRRMWFTGEHREVIAPTRLVYTEAMADEHGNVLSPAHMGMPPGHPATTEVSVEFAEVGGRTKMKMIHAGIAADSPGAAGWTMALGKLAARLEAHGVR